jgi:hypothetical protein
MGSVPAWRWLRQLLTWVLLGTILSGCATLGAGNPDIEMGSRVGLRPDEPTIKLASADRCKEYYQFATYALNLKEAYRTRTTQNRGWIYVAGITGLGVAAASGALAAATAVAAGTLALLAISGGFAAASFATIDNNELANVYNVAANHIGTALAESEAQVLQAPRPVDCSAPLASLVTAVSDARNALETARTNSTAGALVRARAGLATIQGLSADPGAALTTDLLVPRVVDPTEAPPAKGVITRIDTIPPGPTPPTVIVIPAAPAAGPRIALTVDNVQFDKVKLEDIKLVVGARRISIDGVSRGAGAHQYEVRVQVSQPRPDPAKADYEPYLVVGKRSIPNNPGVLLRYQ